MTEKYSWCSVADDEPSTAGAARSPPACSRSYTVLEANDGDEAWELAHEHLPHLVILDVMMPGMSGWEVCRKIREAVSLAHTGVIMLTGIGENLNEMTSPLYGARRAHVDKPFEFAELDHEDRGRRSSKRRQAGALGRPDAVATDEIRLASDDANRVFVKDEQTVRCRFRSPKAREKGSRTQRADDAPCESAAANPSHRRPKPAPKAKAVAKAAPATRR